LSRIYIAGPMTGLPDLNFPAFAAEAARLRAEGHDVVSPVEINIGLEHEGYAACLRRDIAQLVTCDAVQLLPGWELSRGARLEWMVADRIGLEVRLTRAEVPA
jgi:hypothetical protein